MRWWVWVALIIVFLWLVGGSVQNTVIKKIARAIARQEGFYVAGSRPARNHNPGNLTLDPIGRAIGSESTTRGSFVIYLTDADGWAALEQQVRLMFNGSGIYKPDMTLLQIAERYTTTQQAQWANNVAVLLGVTPETKLSEIA